MDLIAPQPARQKAGPVFRGQPQWVLPALVAIVGAALLLYGWRLGDSGLSTYYAASVKSMLENPHAVFFGALDPSGTSTLDKLAGFLVPQALSASIFGFNAWALSLPQVIEGAITVIAGYVIGVRFRGPAVGIAVAGLLAFTPMLAAMFGRPMEDGMLTMCVVLAFAAWQRALIQRSLLWLCVSGLWVAVGFQAKMLQAWLILPALLIAYLVCARLPLRRRVGQVAIAGVVTIILSLSWMTAIQWVPASSRPYIDGTTNNNTYSMVFGYNGADRLIPGLIPGAVPQLNLTHGGGQSTPNTTATSQAGRSRMKLALPQFTTQIGWLYPVALFGVLAEWLAWRRARRRDDPAPATPDQRAGAALGLALWLAITAVVMSAAFVPHATYLAGLAIPLAAFAVSGALEARSLYASASRRWMFAPALVLVQTAWGSWVAATGGLALRWLAPVVAVCGLSAAVGLVLAKLRRASSAGYAAPVRTIAAVAIAATLVGPVVWSLCVLGPGGGGSASDAFAGPRPAAVPVAVRHVHALAAGELTRLPRAAPRHDGLDREQRLLLRYISRHGGPHPITFATDTMAVAVSVILWTHDDPMPMGGFSQRAPSPDRAELQSLIRSGQLRFVLLADPSIRNPLAVNPTIAADRSWVKSECKAVLTGHFRQGKSARQTLYDCVAESGVS